MSNEKTRRSLLSDALGCGAVAALAGVAAFNNFGTGLSTARADHWDREKVHHAVDALEAARDELRHTDRDFHGHKEEAIHAVDEAIRTLKIALENE